MIKTIGLVLFLSWIFITPDIILFFFFGAPGLIILLFGIVLDIINYIDYKFEKQIFSYKKYRRMKKIRNFLVK